jgi:hypothetical protein
MTLSAKWFRKYRILTIDIAAEFCSWAEQRQNGFSISSLRLAETAEVPNTISKGNSLSFPNGLLNGSNQLAIYELRQSEI